MTLLKTNVEKTPSLRSLLTDFFDADRLWSNDLVSKAVFSEIPAANIREEEALYEIELAVPGLSKEAFKINLEDRILTVSAEKKEEKSTEKKNFTRKEFNYSSFSRSFVLPDSVDPEGIKADYAEGLLKITLPKKEDAKNKNKKEIRLT